MLVTTLAATDEPVSLADAKTHLRVVHSAHDGMISGLITAAREIVERNTGLSLAFAGYAWTPEGCSDHLPLRPATVTSSPGDLPVMFTTEPGIVPSALQSAIKLRVQAEYEGDPDAAAALEEAAERIEHRFRVNMGV